MNALFIADAHLQGTAGPSEKKVLQCLSLFRGPRDSQRRLGAVRAEVIDLLVIAGDFFDFWFDRGNRIYPGFVPIVDSLCTLRNEGVRVIFCEGNHDFHLSRYFAERLGFEVYPEEVDLVIEGKRVLVAHGDTIDLANRKYLALRGFLRSPFARWLQLILPLRLLWGVARISSRMSKGMSLQSMGRLVGIMHAYARARFQEGYDAVILGHCHHPFFSQESDKTFVTLGDWRLHDSYLLYREGAFTLNHL